MSGIWIGGLFLFVTLCSVGGSCRASICCSLNGSEFFCMNVFGMSMEFLSVVYDFGYLLRRLLDICGIVLIE